MRDGYRYFLYTAAAQTSPARRGSVLKKMCHRDATARHDFFRCGGYMMILSDKLLWRMNAYSSPIFLRMAHFKMICPLVSLAQFLNDESMKIFTDKKKYSTQRPVLRCKAADD